MMPTERWISRSLLQSLDSGARLVPVNGTIRVDVSPVNDAPINVLPTTPRVAQEDQPFVIPAYR